ncbi:MAG: cryptochrome/photolyase family protein [Parvibaculales bacterium]
MAALRLVLGDQLNQEISSLADAIPGKDTILMCELHSETHYVRHHKRKIAFIFSAMRHFAEELRQAGHKVIYVQYDNPENSGTFSGEVARHLKLLQCDHLIVTEAGEYRLQQEIAGWAETFHCTIDIREDDRFLASHEMFQNWAQGRKTLQMEFFYRTMRQHHNILLSDGKPVGGKWNYDAQNRKPPAKGLQIPPPFKAPIDDITRDVMALVATEFADHFGDLEPFHFAVTRQQALAALDDFFENRLADFGTYQDAMIEGEPFMFHAHIGLYLNIGLLLPMEIIKRAEFAFYDSHAPLNAVEGFIRQILGWREYVRGLYWLKMPDYAELNALNAHRKLPAFFWTAETRMNCLSQCIQETKENAYAHHIQRLMVLGNFALIAGLSPTDVNEWYLLVYADAYEWVELPNVSGMVLFADGGLLASKPYAASGAYINRMSNYCKNCSYKVTEKNGAQACPFNYLYWDFLARNRSELGNNHRLGMVYRSYDKMADDKKQTIANDAAQFLEKLDREEAV